MNPILLLAFSVGCYLLASLISLCGSSWEKPAVNLSGWIAAIGAVLGVISSGAVILTGKVISTSLPSPFYFADFTINMDLLAALMVLVISLIVLAASIYSLLYMTEYEGKGGWAISFFLNLFVASMVALVVSDNAFYFIVFFEMMSLASYFLVLAEQSDKSVRAGMQYFFIAHAGSVLIMIAFFMLYRASGSLNFSSFSHLNLPAWESSVIFLLAFFGFGAKAGMILLHGWLPQAHPAAPSHGSALMSGVMVKIGIFGIIKVGLVFLGATQAWWGYLVLAFGAVSAVLGVLYALAENDMKRLLAYSTVENVGIILMGVGVGMIGVANNHPVLAALGMLGALYHLLNHAVFKGLAFLGAGSVIFRLHTKDMDKMGGLGKRMPFTAFAFLIAVLSLAALPPLNGFVSEWFIYQSLFSMSKHGTTITMITGPIAMVMLAITGALACLCFVKVYGLCFGGAPKSEAAANAKEVGWPMVVSMLFLAALCLVLGIGSPWIAPFIASIASTLTQTASIQVATGMSLHPVSASQAILSTPVITISLLVLLVVPAAIFSAFRGHKLQRRHQGDPWACGYAYEQRMTVNSSGLVQPVRLMFAPLYRLREQLDPSGWMSKVLAGSTAGAAWVEPMFDRYLVQPVCRAALGVSRGISWLQAGDFRIYSLYIVIALLFLLFLPFLSGVS
ncbi:hydrogenase 4 subunit B [Dongshaea marina]|uniref:hydrogenase 4 subunit B n=1 Tax=Dongshaea marina TaxID=2047966 RepID=UPI000D3E36B8|nr:hydrogenase 4 subunit B [Dongshaea marina]